MVGGTAVVVVVVVLVVEVVVVVVVVTGARPMGATTAFEGATFGASDSLPVDEEQLASTPRQRATNPTIARRLPIGRLIVDLR